VSAILSSRREASPRTHYRSREPNVSQRLFRERFPVFAYVYEDKYAGDYGGFRLPLIERAAEAFLRCGDWHQGITRVRCPNCAYDFFVPFSCKAFFLCPSCSQKRTLLLGEYLSQDLLLQLPHRQFVFTLPSGYVHENRYASWAGPKAERDMSAPAGLPGTAGDLNRAVTRAIFDL
jgi:hypothetical protein